METTWAKNSWNFLGDQNRFIDSVGTRKHIVDKEISFNEIRFFRKFRLAFDTELVQTTYS